MRFSVMIWMRFPQVSPSHWYREWTSGDTSGDTDRITKHRGGVDRAQPLLRMVPGTGLEPVHPFG